MPEVPKTSEPMLQSTAYCDKAMGPDQGSSGPFQGSGEYPLFWRRLPPDHDDDGPNKCKCMQNWSATGIMPLPLSETPMTVQQDQKEATCFKPRRTECQITAPLGKAQHTGASYDT